MSNQPYVLRYDGKIVVTNEAKGPVTVCVSRDDIPCGGVIVENQSGHAVTISLPSAETIPLCLPHAFDATCGKQTGITWRALQHAGQDRLIAGAMDRANNAPPSGENEAFLRGWRR